MTQPVLSISLSLSLSRSLSHAHAWPRHPPSAAPLARRRRPGPLERGTGLPLGFASRSSLHLPIPLPHRGVVLLHPHAAPSLRGRSGTHDLAALLARAHGHSSAQKAKRASSKSCKAKAKAKAAALVAGVGRGQTKEFKPTVVRSHTHITCLPSRFVQISLDLV
jgi:hypothetical protein